MLTLREWTDAHRHAARVMLDNDHDARVDRRAAQAVANYVNRQPNPRAALREIAGQ